MLLERVFEAQERERRRIARELHDDAGQQLASLLVRLRALDRVVPRQARAEVRSVRDGVSQLMDDLGRLARGLNPSVLDNRGLPTALRRHVEEEGRVLGLQIQVKVDGLGAVRLPRPVEISLYRIAQEALTNVGRHARARRVTIRLRRDVAGVSLTVRDDGTGFDVARTLHMAVAGYLGLQGILERASLVGGTATIDSRLGRGTTIDVRIPLEKRKARRRGAAPPAWAPGPRCCAPALEIEGSTGHSRPPTRPLSMKKAAWAGGTTLRRAPGRPGRCPQARTSRRRQQGRNHHSINQIECPTRVACSLLVSAAAAGAEAAKESPCDERWRA